MWLASWAHRVTYPARCVGWLRRSGDFGEPAAATRC